MQDWDDLVAVNLNGAFYLVKALLPELRRTHGHVVLVSSVSATWPDLSGAAYQASKAGMLAMGRALSHDEHRNGLRVTTILPGAVDTPLLDRRPEPPARELRDLMMQPQDVADAAVWALCMPRRTTVSEITLLPSALQSVGHSNGVLTDARA